MRLTQKQASMVATALFDGFADSKKSLCCGDDADAACATIVLGCAPRSQRRLRRWRLHYVRTIGDVRRMHRSRRPSRNTGECRGGEVKPKHIGDRHIGDRHVNFDDGTCWMGDEDEADKGAE